MIAMALINEPQAADRRRADDRARRDSPGADPRADRSGSRPSSTPRSSSSPTTSASWPRWPTTSRSCTRGGSSSSGPRRSLRVPAASLHVGAARLDPEARRLARRAAGARHGPAAVADQPADGLLVPPALPVRPRCAQAHRADARAGRRRPGATAPPACSTHDVRRRIWDDLREGKLPEEARADAMAGEGAA